MTIGRLFCTAAMSAMLTISGLSAASSRSWKATPNAMARDYATINDTRPNGELVMLMWFVPFMVQPNAPGASALMTMLQKYIVVTVVHGHLDKTTGTVSFDDITALEARDQADKPLTLLARNDLPPTTIAALSAMEAVFRQSLGAAGNGMKMFVFQAGDVGACKKGRLSVPMADETYTWDTPIPGCP